MKNNTDEAKEFLNKAIKALPSDFVLFEVRRYINLAIQKIEHIEKRREKRATKQEERKDARALKNNLLTRREEAEEK